MSRLYGRAFDVFQMSNSFKNYKIPKYNEDNKKVSLDELINSTDVLDLYLPQSAIDYIVNYPIHIVKSPIIPKNASEFPNINNPNATIYFKGLNFKEEQKRDLTFFLGCVLSQINPDELPKENNLPCEYGDILPLLLEYIYLKENNKEDRFLLKHFNSLKFNAEKYQKVYEDHQKHLVSDTNKELSYYSEKEYSKREEYNKSIEDTFLKNTLTMLVPFSSVDGVLQVIDTFKTEKELKKIIELIYNNENNNRQELLNSFGIESYGYKRLRKELDNWRIK